MSGKSRRVILRDGAEVGAVYDMPWHGQVCLHTEDAGIVDLLEERGLVALRRPPFLDAADGGIHGAYRPRPQVNLFFEPPLEAVVDAIRPALEEGGYSLVAVAPARA